MSKILIKTEYLANIQLENYAIHLSKIYGGQRIELIEIDQMPDARPPVPMVAGEAQAVEGALRHRVKPRHFGVFLPLDVVSQYTGEDLFGEPRRPKSAKQKADDDLACRICLGAFHHLDETIKNLIDGDMDVTVEILYHNEKSQSLWDRIEIAYYLEVAE